ncbi:MAG TPA: hypothetical protein DDW55_10410 [Gammaproteobacteria bacterium]|nr:hypothetical protein [Gammaproteobacteria bacterium]
MQKQLFKSLFGGVMALLIYAQPSQALDNDLTLYLWGAGLSGQATLGQQTIPEQPVEVDFDDILDKLDAGFQAHYEGTGERWGLGLDFTYLKISDTNDADVSATTKMTLSELFGIYKASQVFDLFAGVRFTGLDMSVETPGQASAEGDRSLTDFFGGGRFIVPLSDSWNLGLRGDIGTGDTDLVWNAVAALDWHVSKSIALRGGYRWLDYDLENDDAPIEAKLDLLMDGPFLGIGFMW